MVTVEFPKFVGILSAEKMGSIKDRNGMDLTEAEDIKKRWQEYTDVFADCIEFLHLWLRRV